MLDRITVVLAQWCPHCVPLSSEKAEQMANQLGVELRMLDIDYPDQEKIADSLVNDYGDAAEDYLIPQVFFEEEGKIKHLFTGFSEGVDVTRSRWDDFFASEYYKTRLNASKKSN